MFDFHCFSRSQSDEDPGFKTAAMERVQFPRKGVVASDSEAPSSAPTSADGEVAFYKPRYAQKAKGKKYFGDYQKKENRRASEEEGSIRTIRKKKKARFRNLTGQYTRLLHL